jgi:hypothetical protein
MGGGYGCTIRLFQTIVEASRALLGPIAVRSRGYTLCSPLTAASIKKRKKEESNTKNKERKEIIYINIIYIIYMYLK